MAEVFSNSPCMLGKRVLSPHSSRRDGLVGQLDFSSKKRRYGHGTDQGEFMLAASASCYLVHSAMGTREVYKSFSLTPCDLVIHHSLSLALLGDLFAHGCA